MNKKHFLMIGVVSLFAIALVTAGILQYYGTHQETVDILQPILVNGEEGYDNINPDLIDCEAGQTCSGTPLTIENQGNNPVPITVSEDAGDSIEEVFYTGQLELTKKDTTTWIATGEPIIVDYTIIGNTFTATTDADCSLIYYKDNEANVDDAERLTVIGAIGVGGNLPHSNDWNAGELANYCDNGIDNYDACKGAKLWCVQSENIVEDNFVWVNPEEIYFETNLIQFNSEGELIIYPDQTLTLTPNYKVSALSTSGEEVVTTIVNPTI